jgi:spermidine/putrescine ABC transporter ATP-binding subunit
MTEAAELRLDGISKRFGDTVALHPLSLTVPGGSLVALLGPSGCGKTTTLRIVAGFEHSDTGSVFVGGADITGLPSAKRQLGMVFQNYSLFPHMTIAENVAFGLRMAKVPKARRDEMVERALSTVRLTGLASRYPNQLSGGQQQRAALARSIVTSPRVLLLDEPLGALDKNLRESMQFELRQLQQSLGITTVLVTHDQEEALTMSDTVAVMRAGRLVQFGPPGDVYARPRTRFTAEFLGAANVLQATVLDSQNGIVTARLDGCGTAIQAAGARAAGRPIELAVRPESVRIEASSGIPATITGHVFRGTYHAVQLELAEGRQRMLAYLSPREAQDGLLQQGASVRVHWEPNDAVILVADELEDP